MMGWRFYDLGPSPMMRDLLDQVSSDHRRAPRGEPMPINVHDDDTAVYVTAWVPGVRPEEVEISLSEGVLAIVARAVMPEREYLHQEIGTVEFMRQVALPSDCRYEEAEASAENGVLTIRIPKLRPRNRERIRIQVNRRPPGTTTIEAEPGQGYSEVRTTRRRRTAE